MPSHSEREICVSSSLIHFHSYLPHDLIELFTCTLSTSIHLSHYLFSLVLSLSLSLVLSLSLSLPLFIALYFSHFPFCAFINFLNIFFISRSLIDSFFSLFLSLSLWLCLSVCLYLSINLSLNNSSHGSISTLCHDDRPYTSSTSYTCRGLPFLGYPVNYVNFCWSLLKISKAWN